MLGGNCTVQKFRCSFYGIGLVSHTLITNVCLMLAFSGDDSDAFADDEAPSSDGGYEERDDISLVSTVSSVRDGVVVSLEPC